MRGGRAAVVVCVLGLVGALVGCADTQALEDIPLGTSVAVRTEDGTVVRGELTELDADVVALAPPSGGAPTRVARTAVAQVLAGNDVSIGRDLTVPASTVLSANLVTTVASNTNRVGDPVEATLTSPITIDGLTAVPAGSTLRGVITVADPSGRVSGRASLEMEFDRLQIGGATYGVQTRPIRYVADSTTRDDAVAIGIGAGIGAIAGGLAGGGRGVAIGSAIGAGGGTAVVLSTAGDEVRLGTGTALEVPLTAPLTTTVSGR
jgi:hypothetical protein